MDESGSVCRRLKRHLVDLLDLHDKVRDKDLLIADCLGKHSHETHPRVIFLTLDKHDTDLRGIMLSNSMDMGFYYGKATAYDTPPMRLVRAELLNAAVRVSTLTLDLILKIGLLKDRCRRRMNPKTPCEICYEFDIELDRSVECPQCKKRHCLMCTGQMRPSNEPTASKCPFCRYEPKKPRLSARELVNLAELFDLLQ